LTDDARLRGIADAAHPTERDAVEDVHPDVVWAEATDEPLVTVILCTRARRSLLERCLASLQMLKDPNHEILVVENDDVPSASDVAGGNVRWVHERRPGLAFARNTGVREARGDIVAFVDDDCEVDERWLTELRAGFSDPTVTCVTGRVIAADWSRRSQRWFERISSFDRGTQPARFHFERASAVMPHEGAMLGTGCNMAFRRDVFDRVGLFDTALDTPSLIRGGGDLDMFVRVLEGAEAVVYRPGAVVRHHHRETLSALARQLFGYGVGIGALSSKYLLERRSSWRTVLEFQAVLVRWLVDAGWRRGGSRILGVSLLLFELAGDLIGPFAYIVVRRRNRRLARP
jgi:GT2 family glycosyltransferase